MKAKASTPAAPTARSRLLDAALVVIRAKGYSATTVEDLCARAGVTKGAFFHHFDSKDALAIAALRHWSETTGEQFALAPYRQAADPLARVLGYLDFRRELLNGEIAGFTCLAGTMVQEAYATHPSIRTACEAAITAHASQLEPDIAAAMKQRGLEADWTAESLALHVQAVLQGAFILAKARSAPAVAAASIDHLRRYVELLFAQSPPRGRNDEHRTAGSGPARTARGHGKLVTRRRGEEA